MNIESLPRQPGVYLFKNKEGEIIYIGKAKNIKSRVGSYFLKTDHSPKTHVLVSHISEIDHIIVDNEVEALLLENQLIKKHSPKYNINLKDAKTYAYLCLTDEKFPRLMSVRKIGTKGQYFGPYTDGSSRAELVQLSYRLFKLRACKKLPKKACLNYHIGLCTAPCIEKVSVEEYAQQVKNARSFLSGNTADVLDSLQLAMNTSSAQRNYETALEKKRQIIAIQHLNQRQKVDLHKQFDQDVIAFITDGEKAVIELFSISRGVILGKKEFKFEHQDDLLRSFITQYYATHPIPFEIIVNTSFWEDADDKITYEHYLCSLKGNRVNITLPQRGEKLSLVKLAEKNAPLADNSALLDLKNALTLPQIPRVIECFDISNLGSEHIVAGMTQFVDGKPNPEAYRKFKIRSVIGKNDDFASMREVIYRRYHRLLEENLALPHLIIIDGGLGQLQSALFSLQKLGLHIPTISLAKQFEEIYTPNEPEPLRFDNNSPMMLLVRAIRDSVHRLAVSYNRKRRAMQLRDDAEKN